MTKLNNDTMEKLIDDKTMTLSQKAAIVRPVAVQVNRKIERLRKRVIDVLVEASEVGYIIKQSGIDKHSDVLKADNFSAVEVLKRLIDDVDFRDSIKITSKKA